MSAQTFPISAPAVKTSAAGAVSRETHLLRFTLLLSAAIAVFLAMVPALGSAARIPFLLVFVPLALWTALADTEKALYVLFAWCWMDGTIRGLFDGNGVFVLARDILLALIVLGWGMQRLRQTAENPVRFPPGTLLVTVFVLYCLLQIANPNSLGLLSSLAGLKLHLTPVPLLFVGYDVFRRREQARAFFLFLTLATAIISVVSLVQYLQGPGWTYSHFPGTKSVISQNISDLLGGRHEQNTAFKPPGTTTFGGGTNAFLGVCLPMTFVLLLLRGRLRFGRAAQAGLAGILFLFLVALLLNGVRSGLVSGAVGVLLCSVFAGGRQGFRALGLCAACAVLGFGAWTCAGSLSNGHVSDRFGTTLSNPVQAMHEDRSTFFEDAASLSAQAPMGNGLGKVGPGAFQFGTDPEGDFAVTLFSESYLGCMIIETGIPGAMLIGAVALFFLGKGWGRLRETAGADGRFLGAGLLGLLTAIFGNFFVSPVLFQPPGSLLFWLCAAMLLRLPLTEKTQTL